MNFSLAPSGMHDISKLVSIAPRVTRVTQRLPVSATRHFDQRYCTSTASSPSSSRCHRSSPYSVKALSPFVRLSHIRIHPSKALPPTSAGHRQVSHKQDFGGTRAFASCSTCREEYRTGLSTFSRGHRRSLILEELKGHRRWKTDISSSSDTMQGSKHPQKPPPEAGQTSQSSSEKPPSPSSPEYDSFYERLNLPHFRRPSLPQFHRPTKEELLAAATGFWSRLRIRFKWSTIRSLRPFNLDEITGFVTWILMGHIIWIVIGTTTFVSLAILAINTVFAQETLAGWVGNYLTKSSGLKVVFESAIVPRWGDGVIQFKNVFVSRRPGANSRTGVRKGSAEAAAIAAAEDDKISAADQNYTQFDITVGEVNVTLSFRKWWNSRGLLQNVEVKHVRGEVDRTHVFTTGDYIDPKSFRHEHQPGDFEIESFKVEDLLVTVHQPRGFRPFSVSIYNGDLPRLRKQWLFYDLLSANSMTGEYDRSLFTIHPRQTNAYTGAQLNSNEERDEEPWLKHSRIRVDGLNIEHLNRGVEGPFSWIHEGNVDIVADIMVPKDTNESVIKVMSGFYERMEATLTSTKHLEPAAESNTAASAHQKADDKRFLILDLRVHLNDVRASVPLFTRDLSYVNNALIRPIVAYINSRRTFIPINCRVVKRASDFDGSWTVFDSGLMDDLSAEVYDAFARDVQDEQARLRRFKTVGLWGIQVAVQAIFMGMAGNLA